MCEGKAVTKQWNKEHCKYFIFYAGSSNASKADLVSLNQKRGLGIVGIYLQNIRLRNFLYSRELITWHLDVLEKLKKKFQRP